MQCIVYSIFHIHVPQIELAAFNLQRRRVNFVSTWKKSALVPRSMMAGIERDDGTILDPIMPPFHLMHHRGVKRAKLHRQWLPPSKTIVLRVVPRGHELEADVAEGWESIESVDNDIMIPRIVFVQISITRIDTFQATKLRHLRICPNQALQRWRKCLGDGALSRCILIVRQGMMVY